MTREELLERYNRGERDFRQANLTEANLTEANLSAARGLQWASVSWHGHGERGRMLTAAKIGEELRFFCGCFQGKETELRDYIANGKEEFTASRTKALEFCLSCFEVPQ